MTAAFFAAEVIEEALRQLDGYGDDCEADRVVGDAQAILDALRGAGFRVVRQQSVEDTAAAILAGLIETVRVMSDNAFANALPRVFAAYDAALVNLKAAAELLPPPAVEVDASTSPLDRIVEQAEGRD